jgi:hypothetical protein
MGTSRKKQIDFSERLTYFLRPGMHVLALWEREDQYSGPLSGTQGRKRILSKNHRGTGIRELPGRGRGTCPVCGRTGVKVLYDGVVGEDKVKVCKSCRKAAKPAAA